MQIFAGFIKLLLKCAKTKDLSILIVGFSKTISFKIFIIIFTYIIDDYVRKVSVKTALLLPIFHIWYVRVINDSGNVRD